MISSVAVVAGSMEAQIDVTEWGDPTSPTVLLLHGSGGVLSLGEMPHLLARNLHVLAPSHPGFDGTRFVPGVRTPAEVADLYRVMLDRLEVHDVTVIGFSLGGWIAMELVAGGATRVERLVLVDPIGIEAPGVPILNPSTLSPEDAIRANYHDPGPYLARAATADERSRAVAAANLAAVAAYTQRGLSDATLSIRLEEVQLPTLLVMGEAERIVPSASGDEILRALGRRATRIIIAKAGHRPQQEQPEELERALRSFLGESRRA